jgi:molecular chaperone GrpE
VQDQSELNNNTNEGVAPLEDAGEAVEQELLEQEVLNEAGETEEPLTIEAQLEQAQALAAEYLDGWQRARAEVANLRKRADRDREQAQAEITVKLTRQLLEALDDFDLASQNLPEEFSNHDWTQGFFSIQSKLKKAVDSLGMIEVNPQAGEEFDPNAHEAVTSEASDEIDSGHVIGVLRKGWRVKDRVVRAALVRVAQ